jgi:hypothetical protein
MPLNAEYLKSLTISTQRGRSRALTAIRAQTFTNIVTSDTDGYVEAVAGPDATTVSLTLDGTKVVSGVGTPDLPRNVVITVTHNSAVVASSGTIDGYDINDRALSEAWSVTVGGTSKVFTGAKAFKRVTGVSVTAATDSSANTIIVGTGKVMGLDTKCALASAVKETDAGSVVTNGVVVAAGSGTADRFGTYTPNGTPNGSTTYKVWYLTDSPETSD